MRALLMFIVAVILVVGGLRLAGVPVPFIDYRVGPFGEGQGPGMPEIEIRPPGFDDANQLP